jgi:hypothetical protein
MMCTFAGCDVPQPRAARPTENQVFDAASRFASAYLGDTPIQELLRNGWTRTASFDEEARRWRVAFDSPFPDGNVYFQMDEWATRASLLYKTDSDPEKLLTLDEFRAACTAEQARWRRFNPAAKL